MELTIEKVHLREILPLRMHFLEEANCQIRYNACHERGWSDSYLISLSGRAIGYGSIKGREIPDRDTVFEFFLAPEFRKDAGEIFRSLLMAARPKFIECQSNLPVLPLLIDDFAHGIHADVVLFADDHVTDLAVPGAAARVRRENDRIFSHAAEPVGSHVIELNGEVVATGGFLTHYNPPFADLYMEVHPEFRRRGIGSFLVQELKRECYLAGHVPAARTSVENTASRATLARAGMRACGLMLAGEIDAQRL